MSDHTRSRAAHKCPHGVEASGSVLSCSECSQRVNRATPDSAATPPHVVLGDAGETQYEWHEGGFDVEVMLDPAGKLFSVYVRDPRGWEKEWTTDEA